MYEFGIFKYRLTHLQKYFFVNNETVEILSENENLGWDAFKFIEELKKVFL